MTSLAPWLTQQEFEATGRIPHGQLSTWAANSSLQRSFSPPNPAQWRNRDERKMQRMSEQFNGVKAKSKHFMDLSPFLFVNGNLVLTCFVIVQRYDRVSAAAIHCCGFEAVTKRFRSEKGRE